MRYLPTTIAAAVLILNSHPLAAAPAAVRSPNTVQTYADNSVLWQQLRWLPGSQELVATLTFSNIDYVSDGEPRHDETFNFPLPGVDFDANRGTFYLRNSHGRTIPIAVVRNAFLLKSVELLPGTRLNVSNRGGKVSVELLTD
jgi:hypothetical protein